MVCHREVVETIEREAVMLTNHMMLLKRYPNELDPLQFRFVLMPASDVSSFLLIIYITFFFCYLLSLLLFVELHWEAILLCDCSSWSFWGRPLSGNCKEALTWGTMQLDHVIQESVNKHRADLLGLAQRKSSWTPTHTESKSCTKTYGDKRKLAAIVRVRLFCWLLLHAHFFNKVALVTWTQESVR